MGFELQTLSTRYNVITIELSLEYTLNFKQIIKNDS